MTFRRWGWGDDGYFSQQLITAFDHLHRNNLAKSSSCSATLICISTDSATLPPPLKAFECEAEDKSDLENQVKGYLVANTRQNRAFAEIMRLIEWATTPPSSAGRSPAA